MITGVRRPDPPTCILRRAAWPASHLGCPSPAVCGCVGSRAPAIWCSVFPSQILRNTQPARSSFHTSQHLRQANCSWDSLAINFKKCCQLLPILTYESLWRSVAQILATSWAANPPHRLTFRTQLLEPGKPQNDGKNSTFHAIPTRQTPSCPASPLYGAVKHLCCQTCNTCGQLSV